MLFIFPGTVRVLVSSQSRVPGLAFSRRIRSRFELACAEADEGNAPAAKPKPAAAARLRTSRRWMPRLELFVSLMFDAGFVSSYDPKAVSLVTGNVFPWPPIELVEDRFVYWENERIEKGAKIPGYE